MYLVLTFKQTSQVTITFMWLDLLSIVLFWYCAFKIQEKREFSVLAVLLDTHFITKMIYYISEMICASDHCFCYHDTAFLLFYCMLSHTHSKKRLIPDNSCPLNEMYACHLEIDT